MRLKMSSPPTPTFTCNEEDSDIKNNMLFELLAGRNKQQHQEVVKGKVRCHHQDLEDEVDDTISSPVANLAQPLLSDDENIYIHNEVRILRNF